MYHLATVFPSARRLRRLPLSRDQFILLLVAVNFLMLGLETYMAHIISGTIRPLEWIPIVYSPSAGVLLLLAGLAGLKRPDWARWMRTLTCLSSMVVGVLGTYYHLARALAPAAPAGQVAMWQRILMAPPFLAPPVFVLLGLIGCVAVWREQPADSGHLALSPRIGLCVPLSKTQLYLLLIGLGILMTLSSSVLDHARARFENPWLWAPTVIGLFATLACLTLGVLERPGRVDLLVFLAAMALMLLVGPLGSWLHLRSDMVTGGTIVIERLLRGAPVMAPMLYANMGLFGLLALLEPDRAE